MSNLTSNALNDNQGELKQIDNFSTLNIDNLIKKESDNQDCLENSKFVHSPA